MSHNPGRVLSVSLFLFYPPSCDMNASAVPWAIHIERFASLLLFCPTSTYRIEKQINKISRFRVRFTIVFPCVYRSADLHIKNKAPPFGREGWINCRDEKIVCRS